MITQAVKNEFKTEDAKESGCFLLLSFLSGKTLRTGWATRRLSVFRLPPPPRVRAGVFHTQPPRQGQLVHQKQSAVEGAGGPAAGGSVGDVGLFHQHLHCHPPIPLPLLSDQDSPDSLS